jgi:ATP-dependent DNA ligase
MTYHAQLCQLSGNWDGRTVPAAAMVELKVDAWRGLYLRDRQDRPGLWSRNGIPLPGVEHILHQLAAFERHAGEPMFFDGEFCVGEGPDTLKATKHWCETGHKLGGVAGRFYLFDGFSEREWLAGGTETPLWQRKARLARIAEAVAADADHAWEWRAGSRGADEGASPVELVKHAEAWHVDDVIEQAGAIWQAGGEGVVVKNPFGGYRRNRSQDWLKCGRPWRDKLRWKRAA